MRSRSKPSTRKGKWNDIYIEDPQKAALAQARSGLMMHVQDQVEAWKVTQAVAAARLGVAQPRVNDLLSGRLSIFSFDALYQFACASGLQLTITAEASAVRQVGIPRKRSTRRPTPGIQPSS